jgi:hypothetical protein
MSTVRLRRLNADFVNLKEYVRRHPRLRLIQSDGDPPERYQIEYRVRSLRMIDGELKPVPSHLVEIALPLGYPRTPPQCRMLTPVFHPNIAPHAICVGDHWGAGESLQSIVARIGEMLSYQSYNVKSPLNGEAARWVEQNKSQLPLDGVSMLVEDEQAPPAAANSTAPSRPSVPSPPSAAPPPPADAAPATTVAVACSHCSSTYQLPAEFVGRKVRCRKCQEVFVAAVVS